jgi:hypothetical protein
MFGAKACMLPAPRANGRTNHGVGGAEWTAQAGLGLEVKFYVGKRDRQKPGVPAAQCACAGDWG